MRTILLFIILIGQSNSLLSSNHAVPMCSTEPIFDGTRQGRLLHCSARQVNKLPPKSFIQAPNMEASLAHPLPKLSPIRHLGCSARLGSQQPCLLFPPPGVSSGHPAYQGRQRESVTAGAIAMPLPSPCELRSLLQFEARGQAMPLAFLNLRRPPPPT